MVKALCVVVAALCSQISACKCVAVTRLVQSSLLSSGTCGDKVPPVRLRSVHTGSNGLQVSGVALHNRASIACHRVANVRFPVAICNRLT